MKWLPAYGMVQMSADGRYTIQHPTDKWIAYYIPTYGKPAKLSERDSDAEAKADCDAHEATLYAKRTA